MLLFSIKLSGVQSAISYNVNSTGLLNAVQLSRISSVSGGACLRQVAGGSGVPVELPSDTITEGHMNLRTKALWACASRLVTLAVLFLSLSMAVQAAGTASTPPSEDQLRTNCGNAAEYRNSCARVNKGRPRPGRWPFCRCHSARVPGCSLLGMAALINHELQYT